MPDELVEPDKPEYDPEDRSTWADPDGPEPVEIHLSGHIVAVGGASA